MSMAQPYNPTSETPLRRRMAKSEGRSVLRPRRPRKLRWETAVLKLRCLNQMDRTPESTNDHERAIAEALDNKMLAPDWSFETLVADAVMSVPFDMSIAEMQFLFNCAHRRMAQPERKLPAYGVLAEDLKRSG